MEREVGTRQLNYRRNNKKRYFETEKRAIVELNKVIVNGSLLDFCQFSFAHSRTPSLIVSDKQHDRFAP